MSRPTVPDFTGPLPQRGQPFEDFTENSNRLIAEYPQVIGGMNELGEWINGTAEAVGQNAQSASDAASAASVSADAAANSAQSASNDADRAESAVAALPEGAIVDEMVAPDKVWSSQKTSEELSQKRDISDSYSKSEVDTALNAKRDQSDTSFTTYDVNSAGASSVLDLATSQVFRISATSNRTISFSNAPGSGRAMTVVVHLYNASLSSRTITWPSNINWADGQAPTLDGTKATVVLFWTGSEWIGSLGALS